MQIATFIIKAVAIVFITFFEPKREAQVLDVKMDADTQHEIMRMCEDYQIDFCLTMAIIRKESSFIPHASNGNCYGLMQIHKVNHQRLIKELGITDFCDPIQNVNAGLYMLRELYDKYEDTEMVLMAYNCGESRAKQLWSKGIYSTNYTRKVLEYQEEYMAELGW